MIKSEDVKYYAEDEYNFSLSNKEVDAIVDYCSRTEESYEDVVSAFVEDSINFKSTRWLFED